ncbi:MAG: efflux transporter outer membrane subunit [Rhodocyclaceae bacterium]
MRKTTTYVAWLAAALALAGCSLAPTYERPAAPVPARYADATSVSDAAMPTWEHFIQEARLRTLVQAALTSNRDLRQALLDIEAARAQYGIQRADQLPTVSAGASVDRQRTPEGLSTTGQASVGSTYRAELGLAAFELDLFGRTHNLSQSALQEFLATEQAARSVRISLVASVSEAYVRYSVADARIALTRKTFEARQESLDLVRMRRSVGAASEVDVRDAVGLVEQARTELFRTQRERTQAVNALQLLVGRNGLNATLAAASPDDVLFEDVQPGLPSALLTLRPDILAAEHRIRARQADIGAARAAFFPRVTLTGAYGGASPELSDLFSAGARAWQFMPQLTLPIFTGGRTQAALDLAEVRRDASILAYEQAIQTAFTEVADALTARATLGEQMEAQARLVTNGAESLQLAQMRYLNGVDSNLRYLDAQRQDFANRLAMLDTWSALQNSRIALYKAMGGGDDARGAP